MQQTVQEGVEAMEEAAGGEAGAAAEYAPWESAEEREEDIAHMGTDTGTGRL